MRSELKCHQMWSHVRNAFTLFNAINAALSCLHKWITLYFHLRCNKPVVILALLSVFGE